MTDNDAMIYGMSMDDIIDMTRTWLKDNPDKDLLDLALEKQIEVAKTIGLDNKKAFHETNLVSLLITSYRQQQ